MKVAVLGECMLELSNAAQGRFSRGMPCAFNYGGDTLNTALYMSRLGVSVSYLTALGDDAYSQWLLDEWRGEGIIVDHVVRIAGAMPGLYMIQTDEHGERSFGYWRDNSAARQWLNDPSQLPVLLASLPDYDYLYLSGITLSLMSDEYFSDFLPGLKTLLGKGLTLAFDINYRPRGWKNPLQAKQRINAILPLVGIALPTWDDEVLLMGDASPEATLARYNAAGVGECTIKLGDKGALCDGEIVPTQKVDQVVDSTGAGDSFNAGYMAARMQGQSARNACFAGHTLAGTVIQHRGAIIEQTSMPL